VEQRGTGGPGVDDAGAAGADAPRPEDDPGSGLRISDAAARAGVSPRTLRYYEELGLLSPSGYTAGGERRYSGQDLVQLQRILELRDTIGMNLDDIRRFMESEQRLDEIRTAYRAKKDVGTKAARAQQRTLLAEALELNEELAAQLEDKLARMNAFRATLAANTRRWRAVLKELE
jgi:DNA-binding transcriptional MerR regulator